MYAWLVLQVGADIVKRALNYPLKLISKNAGVNGSVVVEKVSHAEAGFRAKGDFLGKAQRGQG